MLYFISTLTQEINCAVVRLYLYFIYIVDGVNANMWHQIVDIILAASLANSYTIFTIELRSKKALNWEKLKVLFLTTVVKTMNDYHTCQNFAAYF